MAAATRSSARSKAAGSADIGGREAVLERRFRTRLAMGRGQVRRTLTGAPASPQDRRFAGGRAGVAIGPTTAIVRADFVGRTTAPAGLLARGPTGTKDRQMLVTPAFAQASPFGGDSLLVQLLPFILIFVIMYFLILRPQQRRAKEHQELVKNLRRGDTVITSGGLLGKVTKVVDDDQIEVEIADGVRVRQVRGMISGVRAKGEPVKDEG
jgi:preprotein translocase subunit YajC